MAYTITAGNLTQVTANTIYSHSVVPAGATACELFLVYAKGDETTLTVTPIFKVPENANYFATLDRSATFTNTAKTDTLTGTGNYIVSYNLPIGTSSVKFTFGSTGSTPTGTITLYLKYK